MPRFILLPATGGPADPPTFAIALQVARLFGSHLAFLHVHRDPHHDIASLGAGHFGLGFRASAALADLQQQADAQEHAAEAAWRAFCGRENVPVVEAPGTPGISAEWLTEAGALAPWLAAHGRAADLIVMGRRGEGQTIALDVLEAVLMEAGRPVLIAPETAPVLLADTVAVAWKDTRDAASAVAAALPFIRAARRVIAFTVEEEASAGDHSGRRLLRSLRWNNPNVAVQTLRRDSQAPAATLLQAATDAGATLLAMGCYGHSRLREAVFGGFTRDILEHAPLPVLMAR